MLCDVSSYRLDATQPEYACYLWQDGSTKPTYDAKQTGWYWVDVRLRGCTKRDSIYLEFEVTPVANLGEDKILCEGEFVTLDSQHPDADHKWSTGSADQQVTLAEPGIYWVDVFRGRCLSRDSIELIYQPKPEREIPLDTFFCEGAELRIELFQAGVNYLWSTGSTSNVIAIQSPGEYILKSEINTCANYDTMYVSQIKNFLYAYIDTLICEGRIVRLNVEQPFSAYQWSTGSNAPFIEVDSQGIYNVQVNNLCYGQEIQFNVSLENCDCDLFVPNVFTPNGDEKNDFFSPLVHQQISFIDLKIVNRWGKEVFHSDELNPKWNGLSEHKDADTGVYYWTIHYGCVQDLDETFREKKGYVHLVR